jgi:hypothetical protein
MRRPTAGNGSAAGSSGTIPPAENGTSAYGCKPKTIDPGGFVGVGSACCTGLGVCTKAEDAHPSLPHASCSADDNLLCNPRPVETNFDDAGRIDTYCRVLLPGTPAGGTDYEGRCVETCFVQNSPILARLSQATCTTGQTCAPCYSPLDGKSTGACERDGDAPIDPQPQGFTECGSGKLGYCVPSYAAGAQASQLSRLNCEAGELCAPKIKAADPNACFAHCTSLLGPGACVPDFLAGNFASLISRGECAESELCGPCEIFGTRSGICD